MARFSDPVHPEIAADLFGRRPGNYIIHFADGSAYSGRQCRSTNRIRAAINRWNDVVAVQFMSDGADDECVRADREGSTIVALLEAGIPLRNQVMASLPSSCSIRR